MLSLIAHSEQNDKGFVRHNRREVRRGTPYVPHMKLRVEELRKKAGLTVEALAERAGMSKSYVSEIKTGRKQPNARTLERLARALGCSVVDLIDDQSTSPSIVEHVRVLESLSDEQRESILTLTRQMATGRD